MYEPGDLQTYVACPTADKSGLCGCDDAFCSRLFDARGDYGPPANGSVYLPHSCDQWVIGGPEQIRALIADLEKALAQSDAQS